MKQSNVHGFVDVGNVSADFVLFRLV